MISAVRSKITQVAGGASKSKGPTKSSENTSSSINAMSKTNSKGGNSEGKGDNVGKVTKESFGGTRVTEVGIKQDSSFSSSSTSEAGLSQMGPPLMRVQSHKQQFSTATSTSPQYYTVVVHSTTHSSEDAIFPPDLVRDWYLSHSEDPNFVPHDMHYIELLSEALVNDNDFTQQRDRLILRIPAQDKDASVVDIMHDPRSVRLEISISATLAEMFGLVPFGRVLVRSVVTNDVEINFVELVFRRQFLQRGNIWRFKKSMIGRTAFVGQTVNVDGVQATVQEVAVKGVAARSGIVLDSSQMIFRSRSTRIIWLVQISAEMWEHDHAGDLYYEKFLDKFVGPLLDRWQALSTSHSLSVVFFARTLYANEVIAAAHASNGAGTGWHAEEDIKAKGSHMHRRSTDGVHYQDFFKVVIENVAELIKTKIVQTLKEEFWDFPRLLKWQLGKAAPTDAASGNMLEAINTTLNVLDKHHMDRDLLRTGNSIVMVSASTAFFKVNPWMAQISKQRMMDNGIGLDFVSLSQPPLHVVPLFLIDCSTMTDSKSAKYAALNAGAQAANVLSHEDDAYGNSRFTGHNQYKGSHSHSMDSGHVSSMDGRRKHANSTGAGTGVATPYVQDFYEVPHWISVTYVDCQDQNAFYFLPPTVTQQLPNNRDKSNLPPHIIGSGNSKSSMGTTRGYSDTARKFDAIRKDEPRGDFGLDYSDKSKQGTHASVSVEAKHIFKGEESSPRTGVHEGKSANNHTLELNSKGVRFDLNSRRDSNTEFSSFGSTEDKVGRNESDTYNGNDIFILPPFTSQINGFLEMNKQKLATGVYPSRAKHLTYTSVLVDTGLPSILRSLLKSNERKNQKLFVESEPPLPGNHRQTSETIAIVDDTANAAHPRSVSGLLEATQAVFNTSSSSEFDRFVNAGGATPRINTQNISVSRRVRGSKQHNQWGELNFKSCKKDIRGLVKSLAQKLAEDTAAKLVKANRPAMKAYEAQIAEQTLGALNQSNNHIVQLPAKINSNTKTNTKTDLEVEVILAVRASDDSISEAEESRALLYEEPLGNKMSEEVCQSVLSAIIERICANEDNDKEAVISVSTAELARVRLQVEQQQQFMRLQNEVMETQKKQTLLLKLQVDYRKRVGMAVNIATYRRRFVDLHTQVTSSLSSWNTQELPFMPRIFQNAVGKGTSNGNQNRKLGKVGTLHAASGTSTGTCVGSAGGANSKGIPRSRTGSQDISVAPGSFDIFGVSSSYEAPLIGRASSSERWRSNSTRNFAGSFDSNRSRSPSSAEQNNNMFFPLDSRRNSHTEGHESSSLNGSKGIAGMNFHGLGSTGGNNSRLSGSASIVPGMNSSTVNETMSTMSDYLQTQCQGKKNSSTQLQDLVDFYDDNIFSVTSHLSSVPIIGTGPRRSMSAASMQELTSSGGGKDNYPKERVRANSFNRFEAAFDPHVSLFKERERTLSFTTPISIDEDGVQSEDPHPLDTSKDMFSQSNLRKIAVSSVGSRKKSIVSSSNVGVHSPVSRRVIHEMAGSYQHTRAIDMVNNSNNNINAETDTMQNLSLRNEAMSKVLQLIVSYRSKDAVNPFRRTESVLIARTNNRRRWSHLYPKAWHEKTKQGDGNQTETALVNHIGYAYYGLNWKSLCQPAILPITTDYVPNVSDLVNSYNIQSNYVLILDPKECPFATPEALMTELVCQRLSQEFQLVEGGNFDPKPYKDYVGSTDGKDVNKTILREKLSEEVSKQEQNLGDNRKVSEARTRDVIFYVLSMGHRVQFLLYDPSNKQIKVTQLVSNKVELEGRDGSRDQPLQSFHLGRKTSVPINVSGKSAELEIEDMIINDTGDFAAGAVSLASETIATINTTANANQLTKYSTAFYDYSIWVPQTRRFQVLTQQFWQFPSEFFWNKVDGILIGTGRFDIQGSDGHRYGDEIRAKRLRFAVLPDIVTTEKELADYFAKIERLLQFFRDKVFKGERPIDVKFDNTLKPTTTTTAQEMASSHEDDNKGSSASKASAPTTIGNVVIHARAPRTIITRKDYTVPIWLRPPVSGEYATANGHEDIKDKDIPKDYKPSTFCPEWAFLKYDATVSAHRVFLIELHWLVCDSWNMDKFVNLLFRRCSTWGIKLAQIPEFFISANLQLHPYRAQPYLAVPLTTSMPKTVRSYHMRDGVLVYHDEKPAYPTAVELVERLYLKVRGKAWIEDEARRTNWSELGLPIPEYRNSSIAAEVDSATALWSEPISAISEEKVASPPQATNIPPAAVIVTPPPQPAKEVEGRGLGTLLSAPLTFLAQTLSSSESVPVPTESSLSKLPDSIKAVSSVNSTSIATSATTTAAATTTVAVAAAVAFIPTSPQPLRKLTSLRPSQPQSSLGGQHQLARHPASRKLGGGGFAPLSKGASFHGQYGQSSPDFLRSTSGGGIGGGGNGSRGAYSATSSSNIASASALLHGRTNLDRQYMHRQGIACVRVAAHGFVWLLNSGVRVSSIGGKTERVEREVIPQRIVAAAPEQKHVTRSVPPTPSQQHIPGTPQSTNTSVAAVAITAKDGSIINIKERGSNNAASALAAMAAAENAEKAHALESMNENAIAHDVPVSGLTVALSKIESERAAASAFATRVEQTFDNKREETEEYDAQTPDGRRQLALSVLQQLGRFCVSVGNSYDILVSVIENAMDEAILRVERAEQARTKDKEQQLSGAVEKAVVSAEVLLIPAQGEAELTLNLRLTADVDSCSSSSEDDGSSSAHSVIVKSTTGSLLSDSQSGLLGLSFEKGFSHALDQESKTSAVGVGAGAAGAAGGETKSKRKKIPNADTSANNVATTVANTNTTARAIAIASGNTSTTGVKGTSGIEGDGEGNVFSDVRGMHEPGNLSHQSKSSSCEDNVPFTLSITDSGGTNSPFNMSTNSSSVLGGASQCNSHDHLPSLLASELGGMGIAIPDGSVVSGYGDDAVCTKPMQIPK